MGVLNSKEEVYLSNWKDETISIAKDQTITLKAFLFYNVEKGKKKSSNRFFLNNDDIENSYSENIYWAFTISNNIFSYKTVDNRNKLNTISATLTLNNAQDRDIRKFSEITQLNNSINNHHVYKLMRAGKEVTGHTINFSLSDIFSDNLLKNESLRENYYITFFAYEIEEKDKIVITYNKTTDNLPLKQLKIVTNKYSMVFDGYNLELYKNGKYIKNFEAKLMLDGKYIDHDSFPFMPLSKQKYIGLDDLYICKPSVLNQFTNMLDKEINNKNNINYNNILSNSNISDNTATNNIAINDFKIDNYLQEDYSSSISCSQSDINILSLYEPEYRIVSNDNRKKNNTKNNTDNNTKIIINFIIDEKIFPYNNMVLQNTQKNSLENNNTFTNITNDIMKESNLISLSSNNFKSLISMLNFQNDILVKVIYQPKYVIEVTRYKEVYNSNKSIQNMKERYGATYGVFAVYVYYNGEKFLLDSVIDAYNGEQKNNKDKVIDKDNIISTHIETINSFVNNHKNHHSIKTDMYKKNLQNKANYGNLMYGGYTMEPAGPDNITEEVKRRIPEGHYKGIYHHSDDPYKNYTMNLYSDMVRSQRYILVHAGIQNMIYTTGCILVSTESYETGNNYDEKALTHYGENSAPAMKILQRLSNLYKALYDHNINKTLRSNDDISSCISLVIRNQMNRG